ncbi:ThuA domain-containing protein [Allosphingosinicella flava]|uniref:ThuA domain-containing protein n=1 Tax=Allosphingosinicella flava TaxID=2771430 RepID=A0A7T2LMM4_9SPHN|nr:ThuA domain-containing protein [Sphingosinicella flava]QPQ55735.1 ThuA domain-containing protein [Sphingosinicella flava]
MRIFAELLLSILMLTGCTSPQPDRSLFASKRVLIFSHTTGYRHESIAVAVPALSRLVREQGHTPVATETPDIFTLKSLEGFDAIIFLSSTTDPKNPASEWLTGTRAEALQKFVRKGGAIVGIHAASDSHYHSPWYAALLGGQFERHPPGTPQGRLTVTDPSHRATRDIPTSHARIDEWYRIQKYDPKARLLMTLDPASIGEQGGAWPISWARTEGSGRIFYTALGHTSQSYSDPYFLAHVKGGLAWALNDSRR